MTAHDKIFKELLRNFFQEFMELFLPAMARYVDAASLTFLDKELIDNDIILEADLVVKAKVKNSDSFFIVHTEMQAQPQSQFERRMFRYFCMLDYMYSLPVYPVAVLSFDTPKTRQPSCYSVSFPDLHVLSFNYAVIQLNALDWRQYLNRPNPVAAALMAKMGIAYSEMVTVKLECVKMLDDLGLDDDGKKMVSNFTATYLELDEEQTKEWEAELKKLSAKKREGIMEIVNSWMRQGLEQGRQEGRLEGRQEGRREGALALAARLLEKRLGAQDKAMTDRLSALSLEELEQLSDSLLDFSTEADLANWLTERGR